MMIKKKNPKFQESTQLKIIGKIHGLRGCNVGNIILKE